MYPLGGNDSCYDCPPGTFNHLPTDTSEILYTFYQEEQCMKFDCDCLPEAELLNRDECQRRGGKKCVCRRQDRRYGDDPLACKGPVNDFQMLRLIRRPGYELKNTGDVAECDQGYFKNKSDDSICIPHTKCPKGYSVLFNGSTMEDRQCQLVITTVIPLATPVVQPTSASTMVPSVTFLPELRRGDQLSQQVDLQRTKNNGTNLSGMRIAPEVDGTSTHQPEDEMTVLTGDGQSNIHLALYIGLGIGILLFLALVIFIIYWRCKKKKNKNKDLEQDMIPMPKFVNLQNSGTVPATFGETKDQAEIIPLLPKCNESHMDHSGGKDDETLETDLDGVEQYTKLPNQSSLLSSEVSENTPYAEVESYVLHTVDNIGPNSSEEIQIVEESPKGIGTGTTETQQSDQTNETPRKGPSLPSLRRTDIHTDLQNNNSVFLNSLGSLKSEGMYSSFSSTSLGMEYRKRFESQEYSDYGTGSSRRNDTDNSVSLSSDNRYQELSVDSLEDSRQLSTDTQSSTKTGKSVAVVRPIKRNDMKPVDEEETCSKSP